MLGIIAESVQEITRHGLSYFDQFICKTYRFLTGGFFFSLSDLFYISSISDLRNPKQTRLLEVLYSFCI